MTGALEAPAEPFESGAPESGLEGRPDDSQPWSVQASEGYELWAQCYDQQANPLLALEERLVIPELPALAGKFVLDVACGTGRWLSTLLRLGAKTGIGVDCSKAMLGVAGSKASLRGRLVRADLQALPVPSAAADLVICSFALCHFSELGALAAELARVARPQAAVYVSGLHPDAFQRGWRTGFRLNGRAMEITTCCHPLATIREAFAARGLELNQCLEGALEEAERPVFKRANRLDRFDQVKGLAAVFITRFHRRGPAPKLRTR